MQAVLNTTQKLFELCHASLGSVTTSDILSAVRSLPGEPQCAGHPEAAGLRDRPRPL